MNEALFEILRSFRLDAEPVSCEPYGWAISTRRIWP